jgi:hypothetical protein
MHFESGLVTIVLPKQWFVCVSMYAKKMIGLSHFYSRRYAVVVYDDDDDDDDDD